MSRRSGFFSVRRSLPGRGRGSLPAMRLVGVVFVLMVFIPACGGHASTKAGPASVGAQRFAAALRSNDPKLAYSMLAASVRAKLSYAEFAKRWRATEGERKHRANSLEAGIKRHPDGGERSQATYSDGRTLALVREGGAWRLESALVSSFHAALPRDAVRLFATALANRDVSGLLRILTHRRRDEIGGKLDRFTTSLLEHLRGRDIALSEIGSHRAELYWETERFRYRIILLREGDQWRVDDVVARAQAEEKPKAKHQ